MAKKSKDNTLSISRYGGWSRLKVLDRLSALLKPICTAENFWHGSDEKSVLRTKKNWFGTDRFSRVNDFALSVPDQTFTRARTMLREVVRARVKLVRDPENLISDKVCGVND